MTLSAGTAHASFLLDASDGMARMQPAGDGFSARLAREYKSLAEFEAGRMYDWIDADRFAEKALAANAGDAVEPENPADWSIAETHMPELNAGYERLNSALSAGAAAEQPALAATAQAKFDCWVEQQEENHQPDHIAACREQFETAMASLEEALRPPPPQAAPAPRTSIVVGEEVARQVVFFEWDSDDIEPAAQQKIDEFVERMRPMDDIVLFVEGHADRSGATAYNEALSQRRAEEVRAELERQGMNVAELSELTVEARGETEPAVETPDGVRELANRRVEIVARGMVERTVQSQ